MKPGVAAILAAILVLGPVWGAVPARAGTKVPAELPPTPFPEVPIPQPKHRSNVFAYGTMLTGAGLMGASFALNRRADEAYSRYLEATDPEEITSAYDEARRYDTLSTTSLLTGEVLVALGLYLRFLRTPTHESRVGLELEPTRCAVALRF